MSHPTERRGKKGEGTPSLAMTIMKEKEKKLALEIRGMKLKNRELTK